LALVALTAIGLGVASIVTYQQLDRFLLNRVDQELGSVSQSPRVFFDIGPGGATTRKLLPPGTWAQVRATDGNVIATNPGSLPKAPGPKIERVPSNRSPFTVSSPHYCVIAG